MRIHARSVSSCVASRNKRTACSRWAKGWSYPTFLDGLKPAGPKATSVAGLRCGRLRPARLYESQEHYPFVSCRQFAASGEQQRAPTSAALRLPGRRTARLKEPQKLGPKHCPVSASLRLRCRSAAFSRALGNPVKTRKRVLTISLFRRGARSRHCPGWNCSFCEQKEPKKL